MLQPSFAPIQKYPLHTVQGICPVIQCRTTQYHSFDAPSTYAMITCSKQEAVLTPYTYPAWKTRTGARQTLAEPGTYNGRCCIFAAYVSRCILAERFSLLKDVRMGVDRKRLFAYCVFCKAMRAHRNVIELSAYLAEAQFLASYGEWGDCLWVSTPANIIVADLADLSLGAASLRPANLSLLLHPSVKEFNCLA